MTISGIRCPSFGTNPLDVNIATGMDMFKMVYEGSGDIRTMDWERSNRGKGMEGPHRDKPPHQNDFYLDVI